MSVAAYDDFISVSFQPFADSSKSISGEVQEVVDLLSQVLQAQRNIIELAGKHQKPQGQELLQAALGPQSEKMRLTTELAERKMKDRNCKGVDHLKAITNSLGGFGWVAVAPAPMAFIEESGKNSAQFYINRVLKEHKDDPHKSWCQQFQQLWSDLHEYVKQHHRTGLTWNPRGTELTAQAIGAAAAAAPAQPQASAAASTGAASAKAGLFAQLNAGSAITGGLKKVDDSQKTHKNPQLRAGATVPTGPAATTAAQPTLAQKPVVAAAPVFHLKDNKTWVVENQTNGAVIKIEKPERQHTVYVYKCVKAVVQVTGKVNMIQVDSCKQLTLVCDEVIASIDVVNSQKVDMQVQLKAKLISIDKTDQVQLFLLGKTPEQQATLEEVEIVTSKTSGINICTPDATGHEGDYKETPVPEQFKTKRLVKKVKDPKSGQDVEVTTWETLPTEAAGV